jgi:dUTP pyrophosphatase
MPRGIAIIDTGIALEIPSGFFGMVCSRSGLAAQHGLAVLNSPGIIDSDYRGAIKCILINHSGVPFIIGDGMRIAQLIIVQSHDISWTRTEDIAKSERGTNGIGSTGLS